MHSRTLAILLVGVLAAGCFGGKGGGRGDDGDGTSSGSSSGTSTGPAGAASVSFVYKPNFPRVGDTVQFEATAANLGGRTIESWTWSWGDGETGTGAKATHSYAEPGEWVVNLNALDSDDRSLKSQRKVLVLNVGEEIPGGGNGTDGAPPPPEPGVFDCGGTPVVEPHDTHGTDEALPGFAWATLKTGFRFAVAWTSEQATTGLITYSIANGTPQTLSETVPSRLHLLVLDNVAEDRTLCFTATMGATTTPLHAVRTVNAMTSFRPGVPHGSYSVNLLVLVNEQGDVAEVETALAEYGDRLWDATDGWVRAGANLVVVNDATRHNAGYFTCGLVTLSPPVCNQLYDVLFTNNADPRGAASTYRKGVRSHTDAVWMNQYHQSMPGPFSLDDAGAVLTHEMGHYLFNMDDLYGDPVVPDSQDCDVPANSMSIMGGPRDATEFDDEAHPCPTQPNTYVPSWTLLRGEFPEVQERTEIDPGPTGNGGIFLQKTYRAV